MLQVEESNGKAAMSIAFVSAKLAGLRHICSKHSCAGSGKRREDMRSDVKHACVPVAAGKC